MPTQPLSIAIAGSGIAGLYCARQLARRGHRITMFDELPRAGGRIETLDLEGIACECGPMRFELAIQPMLKQLADDLGLQFAPFAAPKGEPVHTTKYTLERDEMSSEQLRQVHSSGPDLDFSQCTTSLDLLRLGIYRIMHCPGARPQHDTEADPDSKTQSGVPWSFHDVIEERPAGGPPEIERYADSLDDRDYDAIRTTKMLGGRKLYTMGLWNALDYVLSAGAVAKIRDVGTFYHLIPENPSASEWSIFWLRLFRSAKDLSTIEGDGGVSQIITRLEAELRALPDRNVDIVTQATVTDVCPAPHPGQVRLRVDFHDRAHALDLDFDHVILALPKSPLSKLTRHFPPDVRHVVDSGVNGFPLLKVFAILKEPWWRANGGTAPAAQHGAHLVPTREVHYRDRPDAHPRKRSPHKVGMVLLYTDRPANAYWAPYVRSPHLGAQVNDPPTLRRELAAQLLALKTERETGPQDSYKTQIDEMEETIAAFAIRDWAKPPFGAASHAWQPGINVPEAMERLKAFSLVGQPGRGNIHVCGEAYSDYQGFIEGALRSAGKTIASIRD
jgi:phytoene dehydrogenase-like protein